MPPSQLSIEQKIRRYDTICGFGLDKEDNRHDPKWKEAYQIVFEKEYKGDRAGNNPLYAWFWKGPVNNRQDPRLAQEYNRKKVEEIGHDIAIATLNLRELTGKEDALLVVPVYQYSKPMWWEKHVSQRWMEICKRLGSIRQNMEGLGTEREEELEHYLASGLELDNEAAYESFISESVLNAATNDNRSGYVCLFLQALDVSLDELPIKYRPYFTNQAFADLAKKKLDECAYKKYLDVIARSRREILEFALENIDFIEEYRKRARNTAAQMAFKLWCRNAGFGCPCASCDLSHEHDSSCQIQHVSPWVKKMHGVAGRMADPSDLSAKQLWEQFMACFGGSVELAFPLMVGEEMTMGIPPLQPRCLQQHADEDLTVLFKLVSGEIDFDQQTGYNAKRVANHRLLTAGIRAINGDSNCYLGGSVLHLNRHSSEHQDHITEEYNLKVVAENGSSVVYSTAKDCKISAFYNKSEFIDRIMESTDEVLKTRQSQGSKHLLLTSVLKSPELMFMLGLEYPYQVENGNIIFREHYLERPPSVFAEDDGSTMQERLEDVFSRDKSRFVVSNQSYPWSNVGSCLCELGQNCPAGCNATRQFIDCAICDRTHIVADSCASTAGVDLSAADWTCKLCSDDSSIDNAQSITVAASVSSTAVADEQPRGYKDSKPASKSVTEPIDLCSDVDEPIAESSSKSSTSLVNHGNELSNIKAKHQLKSDTALSTSLKSNANPGSAMKSDPEYWADVAKFQKETEDLKKEKKETYAEFRDAPDSDDDSESEDMSDEESIPNRAFKRLKKEESQVEVESGRERLEFQEQLRQEKEYEDGLPGDDGLFDEREYEVGDEAHTDDMDLQQSRSDKVKYFSSLDTGDGAFVKRSSGRWEYAQVIERKGNMVLFSVELTAEMDLLTEEWLGPSKLFDLSIEAHVDHLCKHKDY